MAFTTILARLVFLSMLLASPAAAQQWLPQPWINSLSQFGRGVMGSGVPQFFPSPGGQSSIPSFTGGGNWPNPFAQSRFYRGPGNPFVGGSQQPAQPGGMVEDWGGEDGFGTANPFPQRQPPALINTPPSGAISQQGPTNGNGNGQGLFGFASAIQTQPAAIQGMLQRGLEGAMIGAMNAVMG